MPPATYPSLLKRRGFAAFLGTQFLGALNDNLLKYIVIFLAAAGLLRGTSGNQGLDLSEISLAAVLPALVFTSLAGYLADHREKRAVLVASKAVEIGVMLLAWAALRSGRFDALLGTLFLLAAQYTFFGPSKYGVVPELVEDAALSKANGLLEMSTFLAILLGSVAAGPLFARCRTRPDAIAAVLLGVAVLGSALSLGIPRTRRPGRPKEPLRPALLWSEIAAGTRIMRADPELWAANLGAATFWFQGALFQMAVVSLGEQTLRQGEAGVTRLFMALALGIAGGSLLAGRWSGPLVELGLVPLGWLGMGAGSLVLGLGAPGRPGLALASLAWIGASAGLFVVPLNALLQQKAGAGAKGRVQAASNFYATVGMVSAALVYGVLSKGLDLRAPSIVLLAGLACLAAGAGLTLLVPAMALRCRLWLWLRLRRAGPPDARGLEWVPVEGPVLLWREGAAPQDGPLLQARLQRRLRFVPLGFAQGTLDPAWFYGRTGGPDREAGIDPAWEGMRAGLAAGEAVCVLSCGSPAGARRRAQALARTAKGGFLDVRLSPAAGPAHPGPMAILIQNGAEKS